MMHSECEQLPTCPPLEEDEADELLDAAELEAELATVDETTVEEELDAGMPPRPPEDDAAEFDEDDAPPIPPSPAEDDALALDAPPMPPSAEEELTTADAPPRPPAELAAPPRPAS